MLVSVVGILSALISIITLVSNIRVSNIRLRQRDSKNETLEMYTYYTVKRARFIIKAFGKKNQKTSTVLNAYLLRRQKNNFDAQLLLILAFLINTIYGLTNNNFSLVVGVLILVTMIIINMNNILTTYSIKKGWFGLNSYDAKELILFILRNASNDNSDGPGKFERIFEENQENSTDTFIPEGIGFRS